MKQEEKERAEREKRGKKGKGRRTNARRQRPAEAPKAVHMNTSLSISTRMERSPGPGLISMHDRYSQIQSYPGFAYRCAGPPRDTMYTGGTRLTLRYSRCARERVSSGRTISGVTTVGRHLKGR